MKTSDLKDQALDWAVAKITNPDWFDEFSEEMAAGNLRMDTGDVYAPSTDWSQGGPIIEEWAISLCPDEFITGNMRWCAVCTNEAVGYDAFGPTTLIAAMRCYVASKLGDEVEVPEELK